MEVSPDAQESLEDVTGPRLEAHPLWGMWKVSYFTEVWFVEQRDLRSPKSHFWSGFLWRICLNPE